MLPTIRPATVGDAAVIADLTAQLGYAADPSEVADRLARILAKTDQQLLVADIDSRVAGWVHMFVAEYIDAAPFVVIGGLVVDRDHRRRGVARLLMRRAEEWATRQRCSVVRLVSSSTRSNAHRFYESVGFTHIKTQYAFAKALDQAGQEVLQRYVPRVAP